MQFGILLDPIGIQYNYGGDNIMRLSNDKQLSDFQNFVDNLDENMDEIENRDLSDADIIGDTKTLSEQCDDNQNYQTM